MALPEKRIKKIKLPGDVSGNKTYDIIPSMMQDGTSNYKASLPTLTQDEEIALKSKTAKSSHKHSVTAAGSVSLGSNTTASGGVPYLEVASFVDGTLNLTTKYFHPSFTGSAVDSDTEK